MKRYKCKSFWFWWWHWFTCWWLILGGPNCWWRHSSTAEARTLRNNEFSWANWEKEMVYMKFCSYWVCHLTSIESIPNLVATATFAWPDRRSQYPGFLWLTPLGHCTDQQQNMQTDLIPKKVKYSWWLPHRSFACSTGPKNICGMNIIDSLNHSPTRIAKLFLFLDFSTFSAIFSSKIILYWTVSDNLLFYNAYGWRKL